MNDISHYFFLLSIYKRDETIDDIIKLAKELILFKPTRFFPNRRGIKRLNKEFTYDEKYQKITVWTFLDE